MPFPTNRINLFVMSVKTWFIWKFVIQKPMPFKDIWLSSNQINEYCKEHRITMESPKVEVEYTDKTKETFLAD